MAMKPVDVNIPNFLKPSASANNSTFEKTDKKVELILNEHTIHSIKELRKNFNAEELMHYHMEGDLLEWLNQHYYENEAVAIENIDFNQPDFIHKLCSAFGIDYIPTQNMTDEEKAKWDEKKSIVSEYTTDPTVLSELWLVAMNQEELAELLNHKSKKIYLCMDSFSIPIRIPDVEYINIGNATIDNPYTKTQYEKAGIKISGFTLPDEENPATVEIAKDAAISNGYDDFHETHTPLASAYHKQLKSRKLINTHHLSYNPSIAGKFFKSKTECEKAREHCIRKSYDEAENYVSSGNSKSISKEAAEFYSKHITSVFDNTRMTLESLCNLTGTVEQYQSLCEKLDKSYKNLLVEFDNELNDNRDFYRMYNFDYFIDQVEIEEHDHRISEDFFTRVLETLLTDSIEYTISDLYSAINEIENDLDSHSNTFYGAAFIIYKSYVTEIEKILDKIGKGLPAIAENENIEDYITRCCIKKAV